jgi:hypothetical protein
MYAALLHDISFKEGGGEYGRNRDRDAQIGYDHDLR